MNIFLFVFELFQKQTDVTQCYTDDWNKGLGLSSFRTIQFVRIEVCVTQVNIYIFHLY